MKKAKRINLLILTLVCVLFSVSCVKNTDCAAQINCIDSNGAKVRGAEIMLFANTKTKKNGTVRADIQASGKTDASGEITFTFKLPAVYDIRAVNNNDTAIGIIKLEEGKRIVTVIKFK